MDQQHANSLGQFAGPTSLGLWVEHLGWQAAPAILVPAALVGLAWAFADFRRAVHTLHRRCRSWEFKSPRPKFLLDAWTIAEFVGHKPVDQVRLADPSEQWPDGNVKIGDKVENVEATIAIMSAQSRRRTRTGPQRALAPWESQSAQFCHELASGV